MKARKVRYKKAPVNMVGVLTRPMHGKVGLEFFPPESVIKVSGTNYVRIDGSLKEVQTRREWDTYGYKNLHGISLDMYDSFVRKNGNLPSEKEVQEFLTAGTKEKVPHQTKREAKVSINPMAEAFKNV